MTDFHENILLNGVRGTYSLEYLTNLVGTKGVQPLIFEASQHSALQAVDKQHATFMRDLTGNATIEERDTWQSKELAARALVAQVEANATAAAANEDPPQIATLSQIEMLTIEANYRGVTPTELAETIIAKADLFKKLTGLAAGVRAKARAAIKAATTPEQLEAAVAQAETDVQAALALFASG